MGQSAMIDPHKPEHTLAGRAKIFWSFEMRSLRNVYLAMLALLLVFSLVPVAEAQRTFSQRAGAIFNDNGNIFMTGNKLLTCPDAADCPLGVPAAGTQNANRAMVFVNVDPPAVAFPNANSSSATVTVPAGGTVLFAGLYWGARATSGLASRGNIRFKTPATAPAYVTVTSATLDTLTPAGITTPELPYLAFADVTGLVQAVNADRKSVV